MMDGRDRERRTVERLARVLNLVLVGVLLVGVDLTIYPWAVPVDLLNDALGMVLLVIAMALMLRVPGMEAYVGRVRFLMAVASAGFAAAVLEDVLPFARAELWTLLLPLDALALAATVLFLRTMRSFARSKGLEESPGRWKTCERLVLLVLVAPWLLIAPLKLAGVLPGSEPIGLPDLGPFVLPWWVAAVFLAVELFAAVSLTKRELRALALDGVPRVERRALVGGRWRHVLKLVTLLVLVYLSISVSMFADRLRAHGGDLLQVATLEHRRGPAVEAFYEGLRAELRSFLEEREWRVAVAELPARDGAESDEVTYEATGLTTGFATLTTYWIEGDRMELRAWLHYGLLGWPWKVSDDKERIQELRRGLAAWIEDYEEANAPPE